MRWYVVASQKEARIFMKDSDTNHLKLLKTLVNPLGTERKQALIKKEAGHGVKSTGHRGSLHYSETKRHDPHEDAIIQFAKELSRNLESERLKKNFDSLTIVAEPHLLGKIKAEMQDHLLDTVTEWIQKDLQKTSEKDLVDLLSPKSRDREPSTEARM